MKTRFERIKNALCSAPGIEPWFLLAAAILAYGLFLWQYGFYWDDLPISWIRYQLGAGGHDGLLFNQPPGVGSLVSNHHAPDSTSADLLGDLCAALALAGRRDFMGDHPAALARPPSNGGDRQPVLFAVSGLQLAVGFFSLQSFFHRYLYLPVFISFDVVGHQTTGSLLAIVHAALLFSVLNLWMMEYFYFLELIRPFIIFYALYQLGAAASVLANRAPDLRDLAALFTDLSDQCVLSQLSCSPMWPIRMN